MPDLRAEIRRVADLAENQRAEMFLLYAEYYDAAIRDIFQIDLDDKQGVVQLFDEEGRLRGFSTYTVLEFWQGNRPFRAIFSGDTIIHHRYWGQQALAFTWLRHTGQIKAELPEVPLYWFLIVKGHRTYRYLPAFALHYWPHCDEPTPAEMQALMDLMATSRFGDHYDPDTGLVRFSESRGHLKPKWAGVDEADLRRPEVRHFLRCNPGYGKGDELVCLTELSADNMRPLARRLFLQGFAS